MNIVTVLFFVMYVARDSKTQDSVAGSYESSYEHMIAVQDEGNDVDMKTDKGINAFQGDNADILSLFIWFNTKII